MNPWPALLQQNDLLAAAASCGEFDAAAISLLRKKWPADRVKLAIELTLARRKAADKFPDLPGIVADVPGIEQASGADEAGHKARRFFEAGFTQIFDLCCGIGGDAMAMASIADLTAVDLSEERLWMTRHNVKLATGRECKAIAADVTTLDLRGVPFHLDPQRRDSAGRRAWKLEDYLPGPAFIADLLCRCPDGAIKLGPGVEMESLPAGEVEVINRGGSLVQAVLWTGRLARASRSATLLEKNITLSGAVIPIPIPTAEPDRYVMAVDAAVERAGLIGRLCQELGLPAVHPALGLLTGSKPAASPWVTNFQLLARLPWHDPPKKARQWLAAHGAGIVEVKTRGKAADADFAARLLRGKGEERYTVFIHRLGRKVEAWITRRL